MRKIYSSFILLFVSFFFSIVCIAQSPTITSSVGYPVGLKSGLQVVYGNSKYLLLSQNNVIYQSSTGLTWELVNTSGMSTNTHNSMTFGVGLFVAVGTNGTVQTSSDGVSWTTRTSGSTNFLRKVYFVNAKFFAIGDNRTLLTSTNGTTWTTVTFNTGSATDTFLSLAYSGSVYVIASRTNSGGSYCQTYVSSTAASDSWTFTSNGVGIAGLTVNRIEYLNNKFIALHSGNRMFTSTNGSTWTEITNSIILTQPNGTTTSWNASHQAFNGIWTGSKYYLFGSSAYYSGYGSTFTSTDLVNWTLLPKTAYIVPQESEYINNIIFVSGNEGLVSSTDGSVFSHSSYAFRDFVKTTNKYIATGFFDNAGYCLTSTDFSTWTKTTGTGISSKSYIATDGTNILAVGENEVLRSTNDGVSWTSISNTKSFYGIAYGNNKFVASVIDGANYVIQSSSDVGTTWTTVSTIDLYAVRVKYVGGAFFALGSDNTNYLGRILYSADGITWTNVTPTTAFNVGYYRDVTFDGTKFHFLGTKIGPAPSYTGLGVFFISTPTPSSAASYGNVVSIANPTGVTLGGYYGETLEYSGGNFVATSTESTAGQDFILYSSNGSTWTTEAQNSYSNLASSYASGNTFKLLGQGNAQFTVDFGASLPVTYTSFSGDVDGNRVRLNWSTASEQNSKQFVLEHSRSGNVWVRFDSVAAAGNSIVLRKYSAFHNTSVDGVNYYRLLQQDVDGKSTLSKVVRVNLGQNILLRSYPNPVLNDLLIEAGSNDAAIIRVYSSMGRLVKSISAVGSKITIPLREQPSGNYIIEYQSGLIKRQFNIFKQ